MDQSHYQYDVCFSFATEQRTYVESVYKALCDLDVHTFYDKEIEVELWGKNLLETFYDIYRKKAKYCVMFISKAYAEKAWTKFERRIALERSFQENEEYILPVRFDDTEIPGLFNSILYMDAAKYTPRELAISIAQKLKKPSDEILLKNMIDLRPEAKKLYESICMLMKSFIVHSDINTSFYEENNRFISEFRAGSQLVYKFTAELDDMQIYMSNSSKDIHNYNYNGIVSFDQSDYGNGVHVVNLGLFDENNITGSVPSTEKILDAINAQIMEDIGIAISKELA